MTAENIQHNMQNIFQVEVKMSLNSISEYDILTGELTVLGYLTLKWRDEVLHWARDDFGGVTRIHVSSGEIWTPEILQIANIDKYNLFSTTWLNDDGRVGMVVTGEFIGYCDVDILFFPIDEQLCAFSLIVLHSEASELKLSLIKDVIETTELLKHGEWNIIESKGYSYKYKEEDIDLEVGGIQYQLKLKRRPMFVLIHTTAPLFLLALLNMVIYVVPIQSGERISFSVTVLLAMIFFTSNIGESMPHTALNVPVLSMATAASITLCTFNVIISVIFSRIAAEKFKPVSGCLHTFAAFILSHNFGKRFKKRQIHPGEIINVRSIDEMMSEKETLENKKKSNRCKSAKEVELTWLMVVDIFDWIMFYVHLLVVATAIVLATLFITDVI